MAITTDIKANLCNQCDNDLPSCPAYQQDLTYGEAEGNDNVIECPHYIGPYGDSFGVLDANPSTNGNL